MMGGGISVNEAFEMTIDTTQSGSASDTFILRCGNIGTYNAIIDWGDDSTSNITTWNDADLTHVYASSGTYKLKITGDLNWINYQNLGDRLKIISIDNWGSIVWQSFQNAFSGCANMDVLATDTPDLSSVTNINQMFRRCASLISLDASAWDTSNVNSSSIMFQGCSSLTLLNVTGWDTSSITSLNQMFSGTGANAPIIGLDTWNVESVTNFSNWVFGSSLTTVEYDKLLIAWDTLQDVTNGLSVSFGSSKYTGGGAAETSRTNLISTDSWTITDGGTV
jgi:surface protein